MRPTFAVRSGRHRRNAPLYPDWARAVAPPYPNAGVGILVNTQLYQFQTTDDRRQSPIGISRT